MVIHIIAFFLLLFSWSIFIYKMKTERRTLFIGFSFLLSLTGTILFILLLLVPYEQYFFVKLFILFLVFTLVLSLVILNFSLILTLIISGIKLIYKEGFSVPHALSVLLGISYVSYLIIWPMMSNIWENTFYNNIYFYLSLVVLYFLGLMTIFSISSIINLFPHKNKKYDYIIILGSGLIKDKVPPLLASRILKGIEACNNNPNSKIIFSGGQGKDEDISEAEAMSKYAASQGFDTNNSYIESKSVNTEENLIFSYDIIKNESKNKNVNILVVTSSYHVFRALLIAKQLNIKCDGKGSKTKLYFSLNALIREFIGYIFYTKKTHVTFLIILFIICFTPIFINTLLNMFY